MNQRRAFQTSFVPHATRVHRRMHCMVTAFRLRAQPVYGEHFSNMKCSQINSTNCSANNFAEQAAVALCAARCLPPAAHTRRARWLRLCNEARIDPHFRNELSVKMIIWSFQAMRFIHIHFKCLTYRRSMRGWVEYESNSKCV